MTPGTDPAGRQERSVWWATACCMGGMAAIAIATTLLPIVLPAAAEELGGAAGLSFEQRGRLLAALTAGFVSALVISGPMADRSDPKAFAIAGNVLVGSGLLALAGARRYATAVAGCLLMGIGAGVLDMVLSPVVARLYPDRRVAAMNRLHAAYAIAAVGASAIAALLLRVGLAWPRVLAAFAAAPLLVGAAFSTAAVPSLAHPEAADGWRGVLRSREFRLWAAILFGVGAVMAGIGQWVPALARDALRLAPSGGGMALSLYLLGVGAVRLSAGRLFRDWPARRVLVVCLGILLPLIATAAVAGPPGLALAATVLVGPASGALWPTVLAAAAGRVRAGGGTLFGLLSAAGNAGCFAAPWAVGILADFVGLRPALLIVAAPAALSLFLAVRRVGVAPTSDSSGARSIRGAD